MEKYFQRYELAMMASLKKLAMIADDRVLIQMNTGLQVADDCIKEMKRTVPFVRNRRRL
jgi:hypothetical protein